jgi:AmiR/NasT family two-component response regulator
MTGLRILVAEDEPIIRMGLKAMLASLGYEVLLASDGHEALNLFHARSPDLAILDIRMPFTDGLEAAQAMGKARPIPILILTAFSERDLIENAAQLPIQGYLIKPVDERDLEAAIRVALARFAELQEQSRKNAELREDLESRKIVDRAKGKLMGEGMTEEDAYQAIQQKARSGRITMRRAAEEILRGTGRKTAS